MIPILRAKVLNSYRSKTPKGFYSKLRGHSGVDLKYNYVDIPSPITGHVLAIKTQTQMGKVLYLIDTLGSCHVFAHLETLYCKVGDKIIRNQIVAKSGNSGSITTNPHLHYEILLKEPESIWLRIMYRPELAGVFKGYNTDPLKYLSKLYFKYNVNLDGIAITQENL